MTLLKNKKLKRILIIITSVCYVLIAILVLNVLAIKVKRYLNTEFGFGPGLADWKYELPNNYEIWSVSSENVSIGYSEDEHSMKTVIREFVYQFCCNDRYVCAIQTDAERDNNSNAYSNPRYLILDTKTGKIWGAYYNDIEYLQKVKELGISNLSDWEYTVPAPEGAVFPEMPKRETAYIAKDFSAIKYKGKEYTPCKNVQNFDEITDFIPSEIEDTYWVWQKFSVYVGSLDSDEIYLYVETDNKDCKYNIYCNKDKLIN